MMRTNAGLPNYAAECAMKCADPAFKRFLWEHHGFDISDRERIACQIREFLDVESRSDLNADQLAADRWLSMRASFEAWMIVA
ncbi:hypothetical protein [Neorhizobium alkalisoli]|uniref:Uncharacterized protein n=1 Tax=Neorhizobium alkalisoli TaxID=528178 RepID=A0A561QSF9_9HYPH|nr:hypothetical protein [Neorhizobium alkalisoli]TWF53236.1 hypothetical protein FHW37_104513 [Neorhizobium alkalisoli]